MVKTPQTTSPSLSPTVPPSQGGTIQNVRPKAKRKKINHRAKLFCHILRADPDRNQTKAAIESGYAPHSAHVTASKLLKVPKVQEYLKSLDQPVLDKLNITAQRILEEYAKIGFSDVRKLFDKDGNLLPPGEIDDQSAAAIESIEIVTRSVDSKAEIPAQGRDDKKKKDKKEEFEYTKKVRFNDKLGALNALAKRVQLFPEIPTGEPVVHQEIHNHNYPGMKKEDIEQLIRDRMQATRAGDHSKPSRKA